MTNEHLSSTDSHIGRVLDGRFELVEFIAKGGMGQIYRAKQRPLDRLVAVKLLGSMGASEEEFRKRFFLEASLCARLNHPNIVRIYDFGSDRGETYYIAMELVDGETLSSRIRRCGAMPARQVIDITLQVGAALVEAHARGLVHRDLKSSNLMMTSNVLQRDFVKLVDFGIAKELAVDEDITMTGALLGSPAYMSPEQINDVNVDARSDLYSLGVIMFQMLTGALPFTESSPIKTLIEHLEKPPPLMKEVNSSVEIPDSLERVVGTCLRKSREERYPSARALLEALAACKAELEGGRTGPMMEAALPENDAGRTVEVPDELSFEELQALSGEETQVFSPDFREEVDLASIADLDSASLGSSILQRLSDTELRGYVGFIDLNCPFCYALHERMVGWGLEGQLEWRMVEHATHVIDGPYTMEDEQALAKEVFAVHHRAPEVQLTLPPKRCCSKVANRLLVLVGNDFPEQVSQLRSSMYRALWQESRDIGDFEVLEGLLLDAELPPYLLEMCEKDPPQIELWQKSWEDGQFDCCIPVITHPASGRVLIGLATQRTLVEFLLRERSRVVDSSVCYYQQRPVVMICGRMSSLWPLLRDIRKTCEILQVSDIPAAIARLDEPAVPDLILVEDQQSGVEQLRPLAELAISRSAHWALATRTPNSEGEVMALSLGAAEYLPFDDEPTIARARLARILRDRFSADRIQRDQQTDSLTKLPSRRRFIEILENEWERGLRSGGRLSFILIDIDRFKSFNDAHGYMAGNEVLIEIAGILRRSVPNPGDTLARFGGNEFAILMPAADKDTVRDLAAVVRRAVERAEIVHGGRDAGASLRISTGTSTLIVEQDSSLHELYDEALVSLREARASHP